MEINNADDFIRFLDGTPVYHSINKQLAEISKHANELFFDSGIDLIKKREWFLTQLTILKDELNKTKKDFPEAATQLSKFEVIKEEGKKYTYNAGLEKKIDERYQNLITSLEDKLKIIETNIATGETKSKRKPKQEKKFEDYLLNLTNERKKELIDFLKEHYKGAKPQMLMCMLYALNKLNYFPNIDVNLNQTHLTNLLSELFATNISQPNFSYYLNQKTNSDDTVIEAEKKIISMFLNNQL